MFTASLCSLENKPDKKASFFFSFSKASARSKQAVILKEHAEPLELLCKNLDYKILFRKPQSCNKKSD